LKAKHFLAIFLTGLFVACFNFARPFLMGADSYTFVNAICGKTVWLADVPVLSKAFFSILPCNLLFFKLLLFFSMVFAAITIGYLGEVFNKKHGWLAGLFAFICPGFSLEFCKFEDDFLAFPFLMLANYFFVSGLVEKSLKKKLLGIGLVCFSFEIWRGSVTYFFAYSFYSLIALIASAGIIFVNGFFSTFFSLVPILKRLKEFPFTRTTLAYENIPFLAITQWFFGMIGLMKIPKKVFWLAVFWVCLGVLNPKFSFHAIPFLAIGLMSIFSEAVEKGKKVRVGRVEFEPVVAILVLVFAASVLGSGLAVLANPPQPYHFEAVDLAVSVAKDNNVVFWNDWGFGYWIHFRGKWTESYGGYKERNEFSDGNVVILADSRYFGVPEYCEPVRVWRDIGVWKCLKNK